MSIETLQPLSCASCFENATGEGTNRLFKVDGSDHNITSLASRRAQLLQQRRQQSLQAIPKSLRVLASPVPNPVPSQPSHAPVSENNCETLPNAAGLTSDSEGKGLLQPASFRRGPAIAIYKYPPKTLLGDLWTLQNSIIHRISVLRQIHSQSAAGANNESLCRQVESQLETAGFFVPHPRKKEDVEVAALQDRLSHFALRLAFSQDTGAREWFISQEARLLQIKLQAQHSRLTQGEANLISGRVLEKKWLDMVAPVLKLLGVDYTVITYNPGSMDPTSRKLWDRLLATFSQQRITTVLRMPWWPHLGYHIKRQRCYLEDGYGFVPPQDVESVILAGFRRLLTNSFAMLRKQQFAINSVVFSDPQLGPLLRTIADGGHLQVTSPLTTTQAPQLTLENLEQLSAASFPPCMKHLYYNFKRTRHLRHWGRLQLWLFLKACGLGLDAQLHWWRSIWSEPDKFDKEIRYNLRHAYGQEGKRADYPAFSCSKIIAGNPSPGNGDFHGCPFRHFDSEPLKQFLNKYYNIPARDLPGILALKESHEYQLACLELFKVTHHGVEADGVGNHPNAYFAESCRHHAPSSAAKP